MFLNTWAIFVGVLAAALPVAVHWLTRPRPARMPLSTLRFVREAVRQRRARHRLRDILVLALRTAAVLLLAFAIARPLLGDREAVTVDDDADTLRVVILDASQSMAARSGGVAAFERARPVAADQLEYRSGLKANLILAAARPRALFDGPSSNFAALNEELAAAQPLPRQLHVQPALNAAAEMLATGGEGLRRELIVVSDFQRANWATADFSPLPADTVIRLESVAPEEPPPNLALLRVGGRDRAEVGRETRLEVEIGNYSAAPQQVRVEVALGDTVHQLSGTCAPRATTTLTGDVLPQKAGWLVGEARLVGVDDALPADNVRPCVLEVRDTPACALLTRQPASQQPSSSYFLERALSPAEGTDAPGATRVARLDPADPDREQLAAADLIVIDHPGRMPEETINQLAALLRRGRGILYIAAEPSDAVSLQRLVESAGGLELPVEFAPVSDRQVRRDLFLTDVEQDQAPFRIFGDELAGALTPLRFSGGLSSRPREGALQEDVLATFNDRSAFLAWATSGSGALMVMNAELEGSNLPKSPLFVPLIGEIAQRLLGGGADVAEFASGEPMAVYLPPDIGAAAGLHIVGPAGESAVPGALTAESVGVLWKADEAPAPGVYQVQRDGATRFAVAATLPAEESDLRSLSAEVFEDRLAGGRDLRFRSQAGVAREERDALWTWLAVVCVGCLLCEVMTLRAFRT